MLHKNEQRVLLIGGSGMLGREFTEVAKNANLETLDAPSHHELDITDINSIVAYISQKKPSIIINTAAKIQVDSIEEDPSEAQRVNAEGPANIARALSQAGQTARIIHISTSDVFGQDQDYPYNEDAIPEPNNQYGKTKLAGEQSLAVRAVIIRTSWLYSAHRETFVDKMVTGLTKDLPVDAFWDQIGNPTWTKQLTAAAIEHFVRVERGSGIYHLINPVPESTHGGVSRYDFVREIARLLGKPESLVRSVKVSDVVKAPRPKRAILKNTKLPPLPEWREALKEFLKIKYGIK